MKAHNGDGPGGARYTRGRRPVVLRYQEVCDGRGVALTREHELKQLSRIQKLALCK
ncbi:MAG: hypothetical protein AB202_02170 [Parcubacteria bacterium C7867-007]|nr:MAG: hypothetical protein AB202_02170 [Parcubacteria bacterium C7867-007]